MRYLVALSICLTLEAGTLPFQKGVNFTAEHPGGYSSEEAAQMLAKLPGHGINSIALVPYGSTRPGTPAVRFSGVNTMEKDDGMLHLAAVAHSKGMRVLLKPQIWSRSGSPSELNFTKPEDRKAWFASYRLFVEHYAALATQMKADMFCVGVEFVLLSKHDQEWRSLIKRARELYKGPITYAANFGPEFEQLKFWDAVDYIGLNNYYPIPDSLDMTGIVQKVEAVQKRFNKPVIFPEAGYPSLTTPNREPWAEQPRELSMDAQARCYEALLKAFYTKPWFQGIYWWKVGTNGFGGLKDGTHTPWGKPAMQVVERWYRKQVR